MLSLSLYRQRQQDFPLPTHGYGDLVKFNIPDVTRIARMHVRKPAASETPFALTEIHPDGLVITRPGRYVFANDIIWCPNRQDTAAIYIACSNVSLDFSNFCLIQSEKRCARAAAAPLRGSTGSVGVAIGSTRTRSALHHVSLCCGTIRGFTQYGLLAVGVDDLTLNRIVIQTLNINATGKRRAAAVGTAGMLLAACRRARILWSACEAWTGTGSAMHAAIRMQFCRECSLEDVRVLKQHSTSTCIGIAVLACHGANIQRCHVGGVATRAATRNLGRDGLVAGIAAVGCTALSLKDNYISAITRDEAAASDVCGIYAVDCTQHGAVERCTIARIGNRLQQHDSDSDSNSNSNSNVSATGVWTLQCQDMHFYACSVSHVSTRGYGAGFLDGESRRIVYSGCSVDAIEAVAGSTGFGTVRHTHVPSTETTYTDCKVVHADLAYDMTMRNRFHLNHCISS